MFKLARAHRAVRGTGAALVASGLALSLVAAGGTAQAAPADRGADWLSHQLTNGLVHNDQYDVDDYGLTADTVLALVAIGGHSADVTTARDALAQHVTDYTGAGTERYAGALAKLLVVAQQTGANGRDFGGYNLVSRLAGTVTKSGPARGRIVDHSQYGDFNNTFGQVLAVRGLAKAGSGYATRARSFLLEQQCRPGYFRLDFAKLGAKNQSCTRKSPADPDATAYAVVQLWGTSHGHPTFRKRLKKAVTWLLAQQRTNGAFVGGTTTATQNANSTGLASWALRTAGKCSAAKKAARWVESLQVGPQPSGSKLSGQRGAIAYDRQTYRAGQRDGITVDTIDSWRRSTAQAAPALRLYGC